MRVRPMLRSTAFVARMLAGGTPAALACAGAAVAQPAVQPVAKAAAQYPRMAPVDAYLMDRTEEIALARSAAPNSISRDATILVLTRAGYDTAVTGTNGFVCMVERVGGGAFDWPERWNPKIRAAECLNPPAARTVAPFAVLSTAMFLAGRTTAETIERIKIAVRTGEIPALEPGAMSYMMSRTAYLTDEGDHDMPHLMFFVAVRNPADWGANAPESPIVGVNYWYFTPGHDLQKASLPVLSVFLTGVATWSDGTPAPPHRM